MSGLLWRLANLADSRTVLALSAKSKGYAGNCYLRVVVSTNQAAGQASGHESRGHRGRGVRRCSRDRASTRPPRTRLPRPRGSARRTLFRYYPSKYDIPWGQFDASLAHFRAVLARESSDLPLWVAVQQGVVRFNTFDDAVLDQHRARMRLILQTPSLQAHSVLMYERWRAVIADYVSARMGQPSDSLLPRTVGHVSLALAISAYEQWLKPRPPRLTVVLRQSDERAA